jgi:hypothetical protein
MTVGCVEEPFACKIVEMSKKHASDTVKVAHKIKMALDTGKLLAVQKSGMPPEEISRQARLMNKGIPNPGVPTETAKLSCVGSVDKSMLNKLGGLSLIGKGLGLGLRGLSGVQSAGGKLFFAPASLGWKGLKGAHKVAPTLTKGVAAGGIGLTGVGGYGLYRAGKEQMLVHKAMRHGARRHGRQSISPWRRSYQM